MPSEIYGIQFHIRSNAGWLLTEIQWTIHEGRIILSEVENLMIRNIDTIESEANGSVLLYLYKLVASIKCEMLRVKFMWKMFLCHLGSTVEGWVNMTY